jgi:hypothetical protein
VVYSFEAVQTVGNFSGYTFTADTAKGYIREETKFHMHDFTKLFKDISFIKKDPIIITECIYSEKYNYLAKNRLEIEENIRSDIIITTASILFFPYIIIMFVITINMH